MAIVGNIVTEVGDILEIRTDSPAVGVIALTGFIDDTDNEDVNNFFDKKFRYSIDGITFTDWLPLTNPNISSISINESNVLIIHFRYEKQGDDTSDLAFNSVTVNGDYVALSNPFYFDNSLFASYFGFNDIELLGWYLNVTEKLVNTGLIGPYVSRLNTAGSKEDYIVIWKSIAKFFAYYVILARKFQQFYQNKDLLIEYLEGRGLKTSINNTLPELVTLMSTYNQQIFKRGTSNIISLSDTGFGELLRLIFFEEGDEFLFNLYQLQHFGWNVNNSSPLYRGLYSEVNLNKSYEKTPDFIDLNLYPLVNPSNISITTDGDKEVLSINVLSSGEYDYSGIGYTSVDDDNYKPITVDENLDYEITFFVKKGVLGHLELSVNAFDKDGNALNLKSAKDDTITNSFINNLELQRDDEYLFIRCIIYNKQKLARDADLLNVNQGNNLKFITGVTKIIPKIILSRVGILIDEDVQANIYNLKVTPLLTPYDRGFIQTSRFITCFLKNRNLILLEKEIEDFISRYLIPYNSRIDVTYPGDWYLDPIIEEEEEEV